MARSKEAIRRRAQKRNHTLEEQQKIDWQTHQKQLEQREEYERSRNELGKNDGWASSLSRNNAKNTAFPPFTNPYGTTSESVIVNDTSESLNVAVAKESSDVARRRQDTLTTPTTSPSWGSQADASTMEANMRLREEYINTGGIGLSPAEQERALILIARDKRKQEKKQRQKNAKTATDQSPTKRAANIQKETTKSNSMAKDPSPDKSLVTESKLARKRNKTLRKRFKETNGDGMTQEEQKCAKILLDRDERKKKQTRHAHQANGNDKTKYDKVQAVSSDTKKEKTTPLLESSTDDSKKARKALRKLFKKTMGVGMTLEEQEKAKILIERHYKKREKRAADEREEKPRKRAKR